MKKAMLISGFIALSTLQTCLANDNILIKQAQIQSLGITTAALPATQSGEVSGLPAQIIVPGNQLFVISTPLLAIVEQTFVGVGDTVKKGQLIARLQSPALAEIQRSMLQAGVQNQLAHENLLRDESLFKDGIISEGRYRASRGQALQTQAMLTERKQTLRLSGMSEGAIAQLQSGNSPGSLLTLVAPIDGVVLEKSASSGQHLDAALPIFKIARLTPLAIEIQAPLDSTRNIRIGADINIPAYAAIGKITAVGRSLTGSNQTILLRGIITEGTDNLRPGQFVEASVRIKASSNAQWDIPNSAISRIEGRTLIFVKTPQGFRAQAVHIVNEGAQSSVISGALKGDEVIAVRGVSALKANLIGIGEVN